MASKKIQLYTDRANTIEASPETSASCVILSDGNDLQKVLDNDLTTPTVVHEETSFKVGVGDINVSPSVVDGEASRMVIKGKTYQNILPEPSLRNSMSKGKTMQKFNEGHDNANVVDGVGKSAILKGQTLVNLYPRKDKITISTSVHTGVIKLNYPNKINTKYLCLFEVSNINLDSNASLVLSVRGYGVNDDFKATPLEGVKVKENGIHKFIWTGSETEFKNILFGVSGSMNTNTPSFDISNIMLIEYQEGMENWSIPYFEGMASVTSSTVKMTGKNWFNYLDFKHTVEKGGTTCLYPINLKSNTTYTFSDETGLWNGSHIFLELKDENSNVLITLINSNLANRKRVTFTTNSSRQFYLFMYKNGMNVMDSRSSNFQIEEGTQATAYEPYKSSSLTLEGDYRGIGNVCDTVNLMTGEKVERVGEIVLDGSEEEKWVLPVAQHGDNTYLTYIRLSDAKPQQGKLTVIDKLPYLPVPSGDLWYPVADIETYRINHNRDLLIRWNKTRFSKAINSVNDFKEYLRTNPITVQYELETPIVKTVDLSSSGNWEKVVLDGSEDEKWLIGTAANGVGKYFILNGVCTPNLPLTTNTNAFCDKFPYVRFSALDDKGFGFNSSYGLRFHIEEVNIYKGATVEDFRQYLSQNPITVWYQTTSHQNSTQVKQPLSFSNGHIQLSSKEGSLIPSLDYEVPTSNSYHMDLMKPSTTYTMKASSVSGTAIIGNAGAFTLNTNRTIISPSSSLMSNGLFVIKGSATDLMILESDLTSKTLPYFKGIKSAFEDESKIEVLSTNHNLWTGVDNYTNSGAILAFKGENECVFEHRGVNEGIGVNVSDYEFQVITMSYDFEILDGKALNVGGHNRHQTKAYYIDGVKTNVNYHNGYVATYEKNRVYHVDHVVHIDLPFAGGSHYGDRRYIGIEPNRYSGDTPTYCKMRVTNFQITLGDTIKGYTPPKSNITKIPLPSPLRSLPNGVRDEVILDRENNKVKVIQRVGHEMFDGSEGWKLSPTFSHYGYNQFNLARHKITSDINDSGMNGRFIRIPSVWSSNIEGFSYQQSAGNGRAYAWIKRKQLNFPQVSQLKADLHANPLVTTYPLETPIITEIDLDGYPYIYKDGHIFLNSEIAPVVEINYNVNQSQQIQSNNETLQRHELDILDLDNLIVSFVNAEYNLRLLKFDMELSMMALAE